ncbi:hypothetical protein FOZ62_016835, partial [Perkinsus olseni]
GIPITMSGAGDLGPGTYGSFLRHYAVGKLKSVTSCQALPLLAASQCIQDNSIKKLAGKKFTISPQAKDRISYISVRFKKEDDCFVKARFSMTMGKIALEKGMQYESPWLKVEERSDKHGNYWPLVAEKRAKRALQDFVDRVAGDAYLDRRFSAFIGYDKKGKLQVEVMVGRTDRFNVFGIIPLQRYFR